MSKRDVYELVGLCLGPFCLESQTLFLEKYFSSLGPRFSRNEFQGEREGREKRTVQIGASACASPVLRRARQSRGGPVQEFVENVQILLTFPRFGCRAKDLLRGDGQGTEQGEKGDNMLAEQWVLGEKKKMSQRDVR